MTDTRTADPRTQTTKTTSDSPPDDARPLGAAGASAPDRAADDRSTERLSTADVARERADEREAAVREPGPRKAEPRDDEPRAHRSNLPAPKAAPLFSDDAADELRERWTDVQAGFVDEPKSAVEQADGLVAEVMKRLTDGFATERQALEQQWSRGDDASTEDLRIALRRYRSFFDRLLSM
jgi:hypothetical protein